MKGKGEAVKRRKKEWDERPVAMNQFGQCLQLAQKAVDSYKVKTRPQGQVGLLGMHCFHICWHRAKIFSSS